MALHVGDVGAIIRLTSSTTISSITSPLVKYRKPSGTAGSWTGVLNGTTNLQYTTSAGDIDEKGVWTFQGHGTIGAFTGSSSKITLEVEETL